MSKSTAMKAHGFRPFLGVMKRLGKQKVLNITTGLACLYAILVYVIGWTDYAAQIFPSGHIYNFSETTLSELLNGPHADIWTKVLVLNTKYGFWTGIFGLLLFAWIVGSIAFLVTKTGGATTATNATIKSSEPPIVTLKRLENLYPLTMAAYRKRFGNGYSVNSFVEALIKKEAELAIRGSGFVKIENKLKTGASIDEIDPMGNSNDKPREKHPEPDLLETMKTADPARTQTILLIGVSILVGIYFVSNMNRVGFSLLCLVGIFAYVWWNVRKVAKDKKYTPVIAGILVGAILVIGGNVAVVALAKNAPIAILNNTIAYATDVPESTVLPTFTPAPEITHLAINANDLPEGYVLDPNAYGDIKAEILSVAQGLANNFSAMEQIYYRQMHPDDNTKNALVPFNIVLDGVDGKVGLNAAFDTVTTWRNGDGVINGLGYIGPDSRYAKRVEDASVSGSITPEEAAKFTQGGDLLYSAFANLVTMVQELDGARVEYETYFDLQKRQKKGEAIDTTAMDTALENANLAWTKATLSQTKYNADVTTFNTLGFEVTVPLYTGYVERNKQAALTQVVVIELTATPQPTRIPQQINTPAPKADDKICPPNDPGFAGGTPGQSFGGYEVVFLDPDVTYATWKPCESGNFRIDFYKKDGNHYWLWSNISPAVPPGTKFKLENGVPVVVQ